jgi:signal peptidase II
MVEPHHDWRKYTLFAVILVIGVGLDQWTKWYASQRLASQKPGVVEHSITLTVPESADGDTLKAYLQREFSSNASDYVDRIARFAVRAPDGTRLAADTTMEAGQTVVVRQRKITVVEGYFDLEYTENPGAAFGLLSDSDSPYRLPFFIVVSAFAFIVILYILYGVAWRQKVLIASLSFIATGALGNFIDRVRLGRVIDFVVWKYGEQFQWPTFNVADAFITVGVAVMLVQLFRGEPIGEPMIDTSESETQDSEETDS